MTSKHLYYIIWCLGLMNSAGSIFCPSYCRCHMKDSYRYVACVNKGIISLDLNIPSSAQWIQLSNNSIDILHNFVFQKENLLEIVKLDLDFNNINEIEEYAIHYLEKLEELDLKGNHLFEINPSIFLSNKKLFKLDLSLNPLRNPVIQSGTLQDLSLSRCQLRFIRNSAFDYLPNLRFLNISFNFIQHIEPYTLASRPNLQYVDLKGNLFDCDQNTIELHKALTSRNISYSAKNCDQNDIILQKMILIGDTEKNSDEEFVGNLCDIDTLSVTTKNIIEVVKQPKEIIDFRFLLFSIGTAFMIGMVFAYFTVALCVLFLKCCSKNKRHSRLLPNPCDPTAPPPPYNTLFSR